MNSGFIKISSVCPKIELCNLKHNTYEIINCIKKANDLKSQIIAFPELSLCGYTCKDFFKQNFLIDNCYNGIKKISEYSLSYNGLIIIGAPIKNNNSLYDCAIVIYKGKIVAIVPKTNISSEESRWFEKSISNIKEIEFNGDIVPFGNDIVIKLNESLKVGIQFGSDIMLLTPPSEKLVANGANIIINLSAKYDEIDSNIIDDIKYQSKHTNSAYLYSNAGIYESTTDAVFSGLSLIAENGNILSQSNPYSFENEIITSDIDIDKLNSYRSNKSFVVDNSYRQITLSEKIKFEDFKNINREFDKSPFVPNDKELNKTICEKAITIQSYGLAKRMKHIGCDKIVLGISGGLDSTLALLVANRTMEILNLSKKNILCITMPGFGTTDRTYKNACELVKLLGATLTEISIKDACIQHFKDINHDISIHDITYENTQARERTQILMDYANKHNGILVGTGDLSELALGWCTYNGDQMSMYGVNASVPKTLVRAIVKYVAGNIDENVSKILYSVLSTPVSPELLPPDKNGKIEQKTENVLCPYEVCDFYLYNYIKYGYNLEKLLFMASKAFAYEYSKEDLKTWLKLFIKRFIISQFKRSSMPDGPKISFISFSPRGDLQLPSDAFFNEIIDF